MNKKHMAAILAGLLLLPGAKLVAEASGVTVPTDVRVLADSLKKEEADKEVKEKAEAEAKAAVARLRQEKVQLDKGEYIHNDDPRLAQRKQLEDEQLKLNTQLGEKQQSSKELNAQLAKVKKVVEGYNQQSEALSDQLAQLEDGSEAAVAVYEQSLALDDEAAPLREEDEALWAEITALDDSMAATEARRDAGALEIDRLSKELAKYPSENDWKVRVADNKRDMAYQEKQYNDYASGKTDLKGRRSQSAYTAAKYYSWKDAQGNSGHQFYQPFGYTYVQGLFEYTLEGGYVWSNNENMDHGQVNTLTDTTLSVAYTHQLKNANYFVYELGFNLPTGKDALYSFNPVMSEDLVEKSRFGEGFNVTPAVWYYHKLNRMNTLIFGSYITWGGQYDTDYTKDNSWIKPGRVWVGTAQWKHLDKKWQFLAELSLTNYGKNEENDLYYQSGNRLAPNFTVNYVPDEQQFFTAYYWGSHDGPLKNTSFAASQETRIGKNIGLQWAHKAGKKGRVRAFYDHLERSGETYDPLTNITTDKRKKDTYGLGYDYALNSKSMLAFNIERFTMKDTGGDGDNHYHGTNYYLWFFRNW